MKRVQALVFGICLTLCVGTSSYAQMPPLPPPPMPVMIPVPHRLQDTYIWCWVTAAQMVLEYRGLDPNLEQCRLLEIGYSLPEGYCCGDPRRCMRGAQHMFEVQRLVSYAGGVPSIVTLAEDPMSLYNNLLNDHPVIIEIATGYGSSHAIVAVGMRFEDRCGQQCQRDPYNPFAPPICFPVCQRFAAVAVNDPMKAYTDEIEYGQLIRVWKSSLIVEHRN